MTLFATKLEIFAAIYNGYLCVCVRVRVITGNNGYVWISSMEVDQDDQILLNPRDEPDATQEKDIVRY